LVSSNVAQRTGCVCCVGVGSFCPDDVGLQHHQKFKLLDDQVQGRGSTMRTGLVQVIQVRRTRVSSCQGSRISSYGEEPGWFPLRGNSPALALFKFPGKLSRFPRRTQGMERDYQDRRSRTFRYSRVSRRWSPVGKIYGQIDCSGDAKLQLWCGRKRLPCRSLRPGGAMSCIRGAGGEHRSLAEERARIRSA